MRPERSKSFPVDAASSNGVDGFTHSASLPSTGKPKFTAAQRLAVFEAFGAIVCCQGPNCENLMRIKGCSIDHHLAWIDGGKHELENWRPLCDDCHRVKSAREHIANCKTKRIAAGRELTRAILAGERAREPGKIKSRGFPKVHRPMQSRGWK
jgi:hypothetical protein